MGRAVAVPVGPLLALRARAGGWWYVRTGAFAEVAVDAEGLEVGGVVTAAEGLGDDVVDVGGWGAACLAGVVVSS